MPCGHGLGVTGNVDRSKAFHMWFDVAGDVLSHVTTRFTSLQEDQPWGPNVQSFGLTHNPPCCALA